jgi:gamma-glutamyltranspeptidase/glutathione hydrolase
MPRAAGAARAAIVASVVDPAELRFDSLRMPVLATGGMVAASQPLAAAAGLRILEQGGNATDAAVAAAAALAVTEPCSTGIGGDCFALFFDPDTRCVSALNGSGRAPAALTLERVAADGFRDALPSTHAHTVTVPGAVAAWADALARHGSLPLAEVLAPAIELAEEGFPVAPLAAIQWHLGALLQLGASPGGRELLVDGRAPRAGEIFRNPGLARALRAVAADGPRAFYEGELAAAIAAVVQRYGGVLTEADLAEHVSTFEAPLCARYRDVEVWECAPNGQGLAALLALQLAEGFELAALDPLGPDRLHLLVECMRLAFADARRFVADPAVAPAPLAELLAPEYAARRRAQIDPRRARPEAGPGLPAAGSDTVYLCAVDAAGRACSLVNSNYQIFGTGLVPEGFGFSLQNRGFGFSLDPSHPNALAPRKRPYHTILAGMLTRADGRLWGPFGVMGGWMQPQGHLQVVSALLDDGVNPQRALDRPRFCIEDGSAAGPLALEEGIPEATLAELAARGHGVRRTSGFGRVIFGRGQVIRRDPSGALWAGSDPRADGCALGRI